MVAYSFNVVLTNILKTKKMHNMPEIKTSSLHNLYKLVDRCLKITINLPSCLQYTFCAVVAVGVFVGTPIHLCSGANHGILKTTCCTVGNKTVPTSRNEFDKTRFHVNLFHIKYDIL